MNENKNKCTILGFKPYNDKETGAEMLRIIICVDGNDGYEGKVPVAVFLESDPILLNNLRSALNNKSEVSYITNENIATGKTKVVKLEF